MSSVTNKGQSESLVPAPRQSNPTSELQQEDRIQQNIKDDPRSTQLKYYLRLLTTRLNETGEVKYRIATPSRSKVQFEIHKMFNREMGCLAQPLRHYQQKLMKDYFTSLVIASRNKWSSCETSIQSTTQRSGFILRYAYLGTDEHLVIVEVVVLRQPIHDVAALTDTVPSGSQRLSKAFN